MRYMSLMYSTEPCFRNPIEARKYKFQILHDESYPNDEIDPLLGFTWRESWEPVEGAESLENNEEYIKYNRKMKHGNISLNSMEMIVERISQTSPIGLLHIDPEILDGSYQIFSISHGSFKISYEWHGLPDTLQEIDNLIRDIIDLCKNRSKRRH